MPVLEVTLAGALSLRRGDLRVGDRAFGARQLRLVTAMLVVERADPVSVDRLAAELWPGRPPDQWRAALRGLVSQARRRLVDVGLGPEAVTGEQGRYIVQLGDVRVDVEQAAADVHAARVALDDGEVERAREFASSARSVLSRPVLSGVDAPWVDRLRDRVAERHVESLVLLGECRSRAGAHGQARSVLAEAVRLEPLREDAWRTLMQAEVAAGNAARALQAYEECRRHLADELGVDPGPETQRLHAEILRSVPDPDAGPSAAPASTPLPTAGEVVSGPPYVGLRSFRFEDAERFFGRDAEVQALVDRLVRHGIVAVVGPSGVGKSSLVRAGLLPALARGAIPDSDTWTSVVMAPGAQPLKNLAAELEVLGVESSGSDLVDQLATDPEALHVLAGQLLADEPPTARLLLVVDQFEELFTLGPAPQAEQCSALLDAATARLDRRVSVVVTLRADFYDRAARVAGIADLLSHSQFVVPPLQGEQVEAAIVGPARRAGVTLEPGLLGRIVTDMAGEPGALPLLQHLLYELWERRVNRVLTRGAYHDLGGVAGALAHRAEEVYGGLDRDERAVARRVLLRAVQPGDDGADTRRPVAEAELLGPSEDPDLVEAVLARLVDARLLTANQDPDSGARTLELAHEALVDGWPRLRAWVDEARGWLLDHRRLTLAADEWVRHDRHDDWLLAGLPLDEAHDLLLADSRGDVDLHLSPVEHDLVQASLDARELVQAWDAQRQEERFALERRSTMRARALVAVVTAVALVAGGLWWTSSRAARASTIRELVAEANSAAAQDPQRSLLLALEAADLVGPDGDGSTAVDDSLHRAIIANRMTGLLPEAGPVMSFDPIHDVLVTAVEERVDGTWAVDLRDVGSGDVVGRLTGHEGDGPVWDAEFSRDGSVLAVGDRAGQLVLWATASGDRMGTLEGPRSLVFPHSFSPDGGRLAVGWASREDQHELAIVSTSDLRVEHEFPAIELVPDRPDEDDPSPVSVSPFGASFSPDGTKLAVTYPSTPPARGAATVQVVDAATYEVLLDLGVDAREAAWSPDGSWLALTGWTGSVVVDATTGEQVHAMTDSSRDDEFLSWNADGTRIASGDGLVWDAMDPEGEPLRLSGQATSGWVRFTDDPDVLLSTDHRATALFDVSSAGLGEVAVLPSDGWTSGIDWSPDGATLAISAGGGRLALWDVDSWTVEDDFLAHTPASPNRDSEDTPEVEPEWGAIVNLDISTDGTRMATAGFDDVAVWAMDDHTEEFRVPTDGGWVPTTISADGDVVATYDNAVDAITVVDDAGEVVATLPIPENSYVEDLGFSASGEILAHTVNPLSQALASETRGLRLWDWRAGVLLEDIDAGPFSLEFSPDDRAVAVVGRGWGIWDFELGGWQAPLQRVDGVFNDGDWFPDARRLATCAFGERLGGGRVQVWDTVSGEELLRLHDDITGYCRVSVSPDGRHVAVSDGSPTSSVFVWTTDHDELVDIARSRVVRSLTTEECQDYLHVDTCPA